jgi:uncharacterized protein YndB with AHSA1/START domain
MEIIDLSDLTVETPAEMEIVMTRIFNAPRTLVFAACTLPEHLATWLPDPLHGTMDICNVDLRPGGAWHFAFHDSGAGEADRYGIYRDIHAPEWIVSTESAGSGTGLSPGTLNTIILSEAGGKTILASRILFPSQADRDAAIQTGLHQRTASSYHRLAKHLQTLIAPVPQFLRSQASSILPRSTPPPPTA